MDFFSRLSCRPIPFVLFALFAPSIFLLSPNDDAKEAQLEARSGSFAKPFGPNDLAIARVKSRWWTGNQKKGTPSRSLCWCKDTTEKGEMQMGCEKC